MLARPAVDLVGAESLHRTEAHARRVARLSGGHRGDKRKLVRRPRATLATAALTVPVDVIQLNNVGQRAVVLAFSHRRHQLLL